MSRTSDIMADLRDRNAAAVDYFNTVVDDRVKWKTARNKRNRSVIGSERYDLATGKGRKAAREGAAVLLKEDGYRVNLMNEENKLIAAVRRFNNKFRSKHGRSNHDMLEAILSFFCENHDELTEQALVSAIPVKVSLVQAKTLLADPFVRDVIEGLGYVIPSGKGVSDLIRSINPSTSHAGGRPRKVRNTETFGQGHSRQHTSSALPEGRIPNSEGGAMSGPGFDQGKGWEDAWEANRSLSLPQVQRRDAFLDAYHEAASRPVPEEEE